jgi:hypothetical protein
MATSGPTPGVLVSRRQMSSSRAIRSISRCNCSNSRQKRSPRLQHRARDLLQHCLAGGKFSHARTTPIFNPNPHRIPRMLASRSISFERSCLRATSNARTSREPTDLACTGRNQHIRISWAIPRASLRSARLQKNRFKPQLHQRLVHVDDLIEPRAEEILLAARVVASQVPPRSPAPSETSRIAIRGSSSVENSTSLRDDRWPWRLHANSWSSCTSHCAEHNSTHAESVSLSPNG